MKTSTQSKHDTGGWSAKFGVETRKQRHPCELKAIQLNEKYYLKK